MSIPMSFLSFVESPGVLLVSAVLLLFGWMCFSIFRDLHLRHYSKKFVIPLPTDTNQTVELQRVKSGETLVARSEVELSEQIDSLISEGEKLIIMKHSLAKNRRMFVALIGGAMAFFYDLGTGSRHPGFLSVGRCSPDEDPRISFKIRSTSGGKIEIERSNLISRMDSSKAVSEFFSDPNPPRSISWALNKKRSTKRH